MKRHSRTEIVAKLHQAGELARRGQPQAAICKALGISVMTFHRWRKEFGDPPTVGVASEISTSRNGFQEENQNDTTQGQIEGLQLENRRLRKIVTDLLLEKAQLEESLVRRKRA
jgi:putative transposase